jgi:MFS family permease
MRRLLLLVSAIVAADTMFYAVLTPLLPHFADRYHLSKAGAGALVAVYAAGGLLAAVPAGIAAARLGPKRAVLVGLALMTGASLGFALAGNVWTLALARLLQGVGSVFSWAGALAWLIAAAGRERRGQLLGSAMAAAVFGALLGPVLGGAAGSVGVRTAFLAVSTIGLALLLWAATTPGAAAERQRLADLPRALREPRMLAGLWLISLPALLFGVLVVLVPLRLGRLGWGSIGIGTVFLVTTAIEVALNPLLGRLTDQRGRLQPVRAALLASVGVSSGLAFAGRAALIVPLVVAAGIAYGSFYTPGLALISDTAERLGLAQALAFGVMNACWAVGAIAGPAVGGGLAQLGGDALPYLIVGGICLLTYAATRGRHDAPTPALGRTEA